MGNTLDKPKTDKDTSVGGNAEDGLSWGVSSMQGWRLSMEDAHIIGANGDSARKLDGVAVVERSSSTSSGGDGIISPTRRQVNPSSSSGTKETTKYDTNSKDQNDNDDGRPNANSEDDDDDSEDQEDLKLPPHHYFFCVLDGHGGDFAAHYGRDNLLPILLEQDTFQEYERIWKSTTTLSSTTTTTACSSSSESKSGKKRKQQAWHPKNNNKDGKKKDSAHHHPGGHTAKSKKWNKNNAKAANHPKRRQQEKEDCNRLLERQSQLLQRALEDAFVELDLMLLQEMVRRKMVLLPPPPLAIGMDHHHHHHHDNNNNNFNSWNGGVVDSSSSMDDDWGTFDRMEEDVTSNNNNSSNNLTKSQNAKGDTIPGTTAVAVLVTPDWILCANLGDSRASLLLSSSEQKTDNSKNHPVQSPNYSQHNTNKNNKKNKNKQKGNNKKKRNDGTTMMNQSADSNYSDDGNCSSKNNDDDDDDNYWTIVALSEDHKPDLPEEEARIEAANGSVTMGGRVDGELAVSRAFGDFGFKEGYPRHLYSGEESSSIQKRQSLRRRRRRRMQNNSVQGDDERNGVNENLDTEEGLDWEHQRAQARQLKVSPFPEVFAYPRGKPLSERRGKAERHNEMEDQEHATEKVLLLGCDGIWDVMTNENCHNLVQELLAEGETNMGLIAEEIMDTCLKKGSRDNMTMMVVHFADAKSSGSIKNGTINTSHTPSGGGVMKRRKQRNSADRGGRGL